MAASSPEHSAAYCAWHFLEVENDQQIINTRIKNDLVLFLLSVISEKVELCEKRKM